MDRGIDLLFHPVIATTNHTDPMRSILLLLLVLGGTASAQLNNGSFEDVNGPSLSGWEWTCDDPQFMEGGAPGFGEWSVSKQSGHAKGCFPNYLYQRLPNVQDGDLVTLTGWGRCTASEFSFCQGAFMGLGRVNDGAFQLEENTYNSDTTWAYMSITDTIELADGDTAIVVLNAGFIGGPVNPTPALFDGLAMSFPTAIGSSIAPSLQLLQTDNGSTLVISTGDQRSLGINCFDLTGQVVQLQFDRNGTNGYRARITDLSTGVYILRATTAAGNISARFIKR